MSKSLAIAYGQCSAKGRKPLNQDCHAAVIPAEPALTTKGIALALADGISSSEVSQVASEVAVKGFMDDYYATPDSWTVKTSALRVLQATNSWLYTQTRNGPHRYNIDRGYVCTFSAVVFRSASAHIFHVGDARVYRLSGYRLEQLTEDHRLWISPEKSYLSRALGMREGLAIEYLACDIEEGDVFILATDGVYEYMQEDFVTDTLDRHHADLDMAAQAIVEHALAQGSDDNLTIQIARITKLPQQDVGVLQRQAVILPFPPDLQPRMEFDGYRILRELHHSHRSHIYLAQDLESDEQVVIKTPSRDLRDNNAYIERLLMEEWVIRRLDSVHILRACEQTCKRNYLYTVSEYIEGQTLAQWMRDNPRPVLETVRDLIEQIARGLYAMHRQEMLHQDLRPENIMIDNNGTVKLIDFGSVRIAGLVETGNQLGEGILGAVQYTAPEYFLGESGTTRSDQYSLAVIAYQMLSGRLPYGPKVARATSRAAQRKLVYHSVLDDERTLPVWIDESLRKALQANPNKRYRELSEFIHDLRHPNPTFPNRSRPPLLERNPLLFWKGLSGILFLIIILLLVAQGGGGL